MPESTESNIQELLNLPHISTNVPEELAMAYEKKRN